MTKESSLILVAVCAGIAWSCKEKIPYKGRVKTTAADVAAPSPGTGPAGRAREARRPVAAILTAEGSFVVSARPSGGDLDAKRVDGWIHYRTDGSSVTAKVIKAGRPGKDGRFRFADLVLKDGDSRVRLFPPPGRDRPDPRDLDGADPDLASTFYHRERIDIVGAWDRYMAFLVSTEGYMGGAHPYSDAMLVVVDAEEGRTADQGLLHDKWKIVGPSAPQDEDCATRFAGVFPTQAKGDGVDWVALFTHEFEACSGRIRLVGVPPPRGFEGAPSVPVKTVPGGLAVDGGPTIGHVVDWRASRNVVVAVKALGRADRYLPPWRSAAAKSKDRRTRELQVWVRGMDAPAVLGRTRALVAVQFLEGAFSKNGSGG